MHNFKPGALTAVMVKNNFKATIENFVASDNKCSFMNTVKGTPASWKQFLYDLLAMVKQLGIIRYCVIILGIYIRYCADLRWGELPNIINKLIKLGLSDEEPKFSVIMNGLIC